MPREMLRTFEDVTARIGVRDRELDSAAGAGEDDAIAETFSVRLRREWADLKMPERRRRLRHEIALKLTKRFGFAFAWDPERPPPPTPPEPVLVHWLGQGIAGGWYWTDSDGSRSGPFGTADAARAPAHVPDCRCPTCVWRCQRFAQSVSAMVLNPPWPPPRMPGQRARSYGARARFVIMFDFENPLCLPPRADGSTRFLTLRELTWVSLLAGNWPKKGGRRTPDGVVEAELMTIKQDLKRYGQRPAEWMKDTRILRGPQVRRRAKKRSVPV